MQLASVRQASAGPWWLIRLRARRAARFAPPIMALPTLGAGLRCRRSVLAGGSCRASRAGITVGAVMDDSVAVAAIAAIRGGDVAALARLLEAEPDLAASRLNGIAGDVLRCTSSVTGRAISPMGLLSSRYSLTPERIRAAGARTTGTVRPRCTGPQAATMPMLRGR